MAILFMLMVFSTLLANYFGSLTATAKIADKEQKMVKKFAAAFASATFYCVAAVLAGCVANGNVPFLSEA
ncbi:hypothetical protein [Pseudomonas phage PseuP_224]|nr:hypothetical protein [Pseudomonas phage PseuP_224]